MKFIEIKFVTLDESGWDKSYIYENRFYQKYYILRFNSLFDILDTEKTKFISGTNFIEKAVIDASKLANLAIFTIPAPNIHWKITTEIYVNEAIKNAILKQKLTGIDFMNAFMVS